MSLLAVLAAISAPLRILPFGDSLTVFDCRLNAYTSPDDKNIFQPLPSTPGGPTTLFPNGTFFVVSPGGYRGPLGQQLSALALAGGPAWGFVGGNFLCGAHEGYAGETVEWLANRTTDIVARAQPDIVLLMAGTNDLFWPPPRGTRSPTALLARLRVLLDRGFAAAPRAAFLLSTVTEINATRCATYSTAHWHPPNCPQDMPANIATYNALLPALVAEYRARGSDLTLHDVNAEAQWVEQDFWIWGIHFNYTGFEKMATSWTRAVTGSAPWRGAAAAAAAAQAGSVVVSDFPVS
eukprot:g93.t1